MEDVKVVPTNKTVVEFLFSRAYDKDENLVGSGTQFGIQDEVDNVTHFHYHIVDICKNLINGKLEYARLPPVDFSDVISEAELMIVNSALSNLLNHLNKEVIYYEDYQKDINGLLNGAEEGK